MKFQLIFTELLLSLILSNCTEQDFYNQALTSYSNPYLEEDSTQVKSIYNDQFPILFSLNGLYGYLDGNLELLVPPIYDRGFNFTEHGYARVRFRNEKNEFECLIFNSYGEVVFRDNTSTIYMLYDDIISYKQNNDIYYKIIKFRDNKILAESPKENPEEMFSTLNEKYNNTESKTVILSQQSEGASLKIFDINDEISNDKFYQINFYSDLGQTQYQVFFKYDIDLWYIYKKARFYEVPFELVNAQIQNTYFLYDRNYPYVYNYETNLYDIKMDTNNYPAITDVKSISQLIEIIENKR